MPHVTQRWRRKMSKEKILRREATPIGLTAFIVIVPFAFSDVRRKGQGGRKVEGRREEGGWRYLSR